MKKILFLLLFVSVVYPQNKKYVKNFILKYQTTKATVLNGTSQYWSKTSPVNIQPQDDSNLVVNGGFETYTGNINDTTGATFTGWTIENPGAIYMVTDTAHTGVAFAGRTKLPSTTAYIRQTINVSPSTNYTLSFWYRNDSTSTQGGRYKVVDSTNNTSLVATTATTVTKSYVFTRANFTTASNTAKVSIELFNDGIAGKRQFNMYDDVRLSKTYDVAYFVYLRRNSYNSVTRQYFLSNITTTTNRAMSMQFMGTGLGADSDTGKVQFDFGNDGTSNANFSKSTSSAKINEPLFIAGTVKNNNSSSTATMKLYWNGLIEDTTTNLAYGSWYGTAPLRIGATAVSGSEHYFDGLIYWVQVVRFSSLPTNIEQIITRIQQQKKPLSAYPNGNIVAWYDWKSGGFDKSGNGNHLTPVASPIIVNIQK